MEIFHLRTHSYARTHTWQVRLHTMSESGTHCVKVFDHHSDRVKVRPPSHANSGIQEGACMSTHWQPSLRCRAVVKMRMPQDRLLGCLAHAHWCKRFRMLICAQPRRMWRWSQATRTCSGARARTAPSGSSTRASPTATAACVLRLVLYHDCCAHALTADVLQYPRRQPLRMLNMRICIKKCEPV
jgi:hypothetical protein